MNERDDKDKSKDELDEEALEQATGGTGLLVHELTHSQQSATVGGNETITIGASQTETVGPSRG
jgi:hypothetical protein